MRAAVPKQPRLRTNLVAATEAGLWAAAAIAAVSLARKTQRMISERKRLTHAALHDPLTGLANRTKLASRLEAALSEAEASGQLVGALFCDLDGFHQVNKNHGHGAGDLLLVAIALRIESAVRPTDTVARLGGDEFVVICPGLSPAAHEATAALEAIARRIRRAVSEPVQVGGSSAVGGRVSQQISQQISIGAAVMPGVPRARTPNAHAQLLHQADRALLLEKSRARSLAELRSRLA